MQEETIRQIQETEEELSTSIKDQQSRKEIRNQNIKQTEEINGLNSLED